MAAKETTTTEKVQTFWTGLFEGQWERTQALIDGMSGMEKKGFEQSMSAVDEVNRLVKANLEYTRELQEQSMKLFLENTRRGMEMMRPGK